jgi:hypothetical protein
MRQREKAYEAPKVVDLGDLMEVTAAQVAGMFVDRDFPAGTPITDLTFSS